MANQFTEKWPDRFWGKTVRHNDCILWTASTDDCGYGTISYMGKRWKAHRLSYVMRYGEFDFRLKVCHSCDTPGCVNPDHLFLATQKENIVDMVSKGRHGAGQIKRQKYEDWLSERPNKSELDTCKRGHQYLKANVRMKIVEGRWIRVCRECQYQSAKKDVTVYKVKNFVRGVNDRGAVVDGLVKKIKSLGEVCAYCGGEFECLDHITPKALGGEISVDNINPSCYSCNYKKGKNVY